MISYSKAILDRYVAPEISTLRSVDMPDIAQEFSDWEEWVSNHLLNSILRGEFPEPRRQFAVNFIRRGQSAFRFYHEARRATLIFVVESKPDQPRLARYYDALGYWEACLMNWAICLNLVRTLRGKRVFEPSDGSSEQRAYDINNNSIKHHASVIEQGKLVGDAALPMWITSSGLVTKDIQLTFHELSALIRDVAKLSSELQDPVAFLKPKSPSAP